ncbi:hypothetical protein RvY_03327 [Ramazzottius varieornatus]|uniref:EIF-4F 25 kDa subunit n=1 Tax=Ramazzottius varieornatus TaxID=947166 RepID=A0A1D1UXW1_RAMVA|nr:hypothetical protein RvY_03327 [Ramazzottius varieornatus]
MASEVVVGEKEMGPGAADVTTELDESQITHPLATSWTFYYLDPDEARKDWSRANRDVLSFDTVEDFWALYHHITPLSQLRKGSDYSLFRGGKADMDRIKPAWEDKQNRLGGAWKIAFEVRQVGPRVDDIFRELLMICVGEHFGETGEYVNGVVASARAKQFRFGIWTKDEDESHCVAIGERIKEALPANMKIQMEFVSHQEQERVSQAARGVEARPKFTLFKN